MLALYALNADYTRVSPVASGHEQTESETLLNRALRDFLSAARSEAKLNMTTQHVLVYKILFIDFQGDGIR